MAINKQTIISAFDDKLTLLQYLKTIEKLLKECALTTIELIRVDNNYFKVKCNFNDGSFIESNNFLLMDANTLLNYLQGSESVIVDLNENGDKLKVHIDNNILNKINFALVKPNEAPSDYVIVTINDLGQQENVLIGTSLIVDSENKKLETYRDILNPVNIYELFNMQLNNDPSLHNIQYTSNLSLRQIIELISKNINKGLMFNSPIYSYKDTPLLFTYINIEDFSYVVGQDVRTTNLQFRGVVYQSNNISNMYGCIQIDFHTTSMDAKPVYISVLEI